ncbi:MAG: methyl-accepting chemotaxis protein [Rhodoferax sp.]
MNMAWLDAFRSLLRRAPARDDTASELSLGTLSEISTYQFDPGAKAREGKTLYGALDELMTATSSETDTVVLPFLGRRSVLQHQRILAWGLGLSLLVVAVLTIWGLRQSGQGALQVDAVAQAQGQTQALLVAVDRVLAGDAGAAAALTQARQALDQSLRGLQQGDEARGVQALRGEAAADLQAVLAQQSTLSRHLDVLAAQAPTWAAVHQLVLPSSQRAADWLGAAQTVLNLKLQANASAPEVSAAAQLGMLTQRMARIAAELRQPGGLQPELVQQWAQDLQTVARLAQGLRDGNPELRLSLPTEAAQREPLNALLPQLQALQAQANPVLGKLGALPSARDAAQKVQAVLSAQRAALASLQGALVRQSSLNVWNLMGLALAVSLAVLSAAGWSFVQLQHSRQRQASAEALREQAQRQEREAKRINDANQAAILRLMNELQAVAEGDLTQQATVTEDITGAIADSINYTVEELRTLVGAVKKAAAKVAQTTAEVDVNSTELLAASKEQLHEIRETGRAVVDMATRINRVSGQAQQSADVARQSRQAATQGLQAVQDTIGGMNVLRDQIQDTAKRIKRLGESSQEIGEITELISDITEQTNVLALNAAIQAASAGEAGRGFSVVAEEVQRLAERSADATRQIAALVKAIQTDTQNAVAAMERSTQGVVQSAQLADNAGTALTEIDRVSHRLAELIEQITAATLSEANQANDVAASIQHIFAVTEQTSEGTRTTATQVRELAGMAAQLRQLVERFRLSADESQPRSE